jgi:hypothetical protein
MKHVRTFEKYRIVKNREELIKLFFKLMIFILKL